VPSVRKQLEDSLRDALKIVTIGRPSHVSSMVPEASNLAAYLNIFRC
jgi:hypothetical protein